MYPISLVWDGASSTIAFSNNSTIFSNVSIIEISFRSFVWKLFNISLIWGIFERDILRDSKSLGDAISDVILEVILWISNISSNKFLISPLSITSSFNSSIASNLSSIFFLSIRGFVKWVFNNLAPSGVFVLFKIPKRVFDLSFVNIVSVISKFLSEIESRISDLFVCKYLIWLICERSNFCNL